MIQGAVLGSARGTAAQRPKPPILATKGTRPFIFAKGTRPFIFPDSRSNAATLAASGRLPSNPMPRRSRMVFPGIPHHVTQRGNHRERVFFENGDPEAYLSLLHAHTRRYELQVFAYCLMPNHVHLVVVPTSTDCMHRALRAVHSQYAQRVNRMRRITGHLWQGRYGSSPMDSNHFLNVVRYVELNPVNAGLVAKAEDYAWSSAAAHCGQRYDPVLEPTHRASHLKGIANWSRWLADGIPEDFQEYLQSRERGNLPCGSAEFVAGLEQSAGCELRFRTRGGQRKK